jgi:hypothetical protein
MTEVKEAVEQNGLVSNLYGGLRVLLSGRSELLSIKVSWNDSYFENKYNFLTSFIDFNYWDYIELFLAAEILNQADSEKFDHLTIIDTTKLLLLNMVSFHLEVKPSKKLILKLIQNEDELNQNIGFYFLSRIISGCVSDINYIQRSKKSGIKPSKRISVVRRDLVAGLTECAELLEKCSKQTQASLLLNYLLSNQNAYPIAFARWLMSSDLQDEFVYQINNKNKLKILKDVSFLTEIIAHTPATNASKKRTSKKRLYDAITNVLANFIQERKGIYEWDEPQNIYFQAICRRLPKSCLTKLKKHLLKKSAELMPNKLDELVRYRLFLEDSRQHRIIDGMLTDINSLPFGKR